MKDFYPFVLCANHVALQLLGTVGFFLEEDRLKAVELNTCHFPGRR
jgi:hypothetical protein